MVGEQNIWQVSKDLLDLSLTVGRSSALWEGKLCIGGFAIRYGARK